MVGVGLARERSGEEGIVGVVVVVDEFIGDIDGLSSAGGSAEEDMHVVLDVEVEEVVEADGVVGGDEQIVVADLLRDLEGRSSLRPVLPHKLLGVVEHVEDVHLLWHLQAENDRGQLVVRVQAKRREQVRRAGVEVHVELTELLAAGLLHGDTQ